MRHGQEFRATIRQGSRAGRDTLVVHCRAGTGRTGSHVGLVVARSVGNAVVRNRVKRRLRAVVLADIDALPTGSDVVVRALPRAGTSAYEQIAADYQGALRAAVARSSSRAARS
ncbi:ribonuclease P protein component [Cellulomonas bogoriensis]